MKKIDKKDWQNLMESLPLKSNRWKSCMVYTLWNPKDINQLNALLQVINTEDYDLFVMIINVLNAVDFNISDNIKLMLLSKIRKYIKTVPSFDGDLFIEYYSKIVSDPELLAN